MPVAFRFAGVSVCFVFCFVDPRMAGRWYSVYGRDLKSTASQPRDLNHGTDGGRGVQPRAMHPENHQQTPQYITHCEHPFARSLSAIRNLLTSSSSGFVISA
ncbi:hypothetical protein P170DRAFT_129754 [Aspergillus steynii IBT 23096]|uniref:Secreted protein n=1 Tax=Aspergillus steynii IBT 23096 TaxID=1392250 RepID=A0A2I2GKK1_9EURO|nr:uncharacterized protein P170DRAFT_129754 [Aspergillus steynii IBT 23096]PLB53412.1 hypothetical protein P170DRAFT_129754 [Aspergillus steynii IBT 23096]